MSPQFYLPPTSMQTISRSLLPWPFIFSSVTDFFLFMEHLYLDVLPSSKSKHGVKKEIHGLPLAYLLCFPCILISRQRPWASLAHFYSFTISIWYPVLLISTVIFIISVLRHFQFQPCPCPVYPEYFKGSLVSLLAQILSLFSWTLWKAIESFYSNKCLLNSKTNSFPD